MYTIGNFTHDETGTPFMLNVLMTMWQHIKRGTNYLVLRNDAVCQSDMVEGDEVVVYVGTDNKWHVRRKEEFEDGRFRLHS